MPNIFKRPMFRKGGSTSEGTGITSGLTPRQNYQDQGNVQKKEPYEILIENQYQKMLPSQADSIRNYITGFGASADKDPMALQTFGSAFGQASKIGAGLNAQQVAQAEKFRTQAGIQAVKNLTKQDEAKITAAMTNAREYARVNFDRYPGATQQEKMQNAYRDKFSQLLSRERATTYESEIIQEKINQLNKDNDFRKVANKQPYAQTVRDFEKGKVKVNGIVVPNPSGLIKLDVIQIKEDGVTAEVIKELPGYNNIISNTFKPNNIYIDVKTGIVFQYQGKGTFKRVYP